jgi:hypothetical protein
MLAAIVDALAVINAVAIGVLVVVTAYYAWQTHKMAREMRQARLLSLLPKLVLDIEMVGPRHGNIVVQNVGPGPAIDADLVIVFDAADEGAVDPGKRDFVRLGIDTLLAEGNLVEKAGSRNARLLHSEKPYREANDARV